MKATYTKYVIIFMSVLIFFGGIYILKSLKDGDQDSSDLNTNSISQTNNNNGKLKTDNYLYTTVDNLSVRKSPSLDAKRISTLDEGVRVTFLGNESANVISVKLRGKQTTGPFYYVRIPSGKEGWIYSGALSSTPVYVEDYNAIIIYNNDDNVDFLIWTKRDIQQFLEYNNRKDIKLITKTDNFSEVNIINDEGEIIGVENIRRTVDKYNYGMVLFSKGKKSKSIEAGGEWFEYNKLCFIEDYFRLKKSCDDFDLIYN
jgi:hypothetical protein